MADENNNANPEVILSGEGPQDNGVLVDKTRDESGRFINGHPKIGNGKPKGYISPHRAINNKLQEIQEITIGNRQKQMLGVEVLVEVLFKLAVGGNLGAIKEFFDRIEGRPKILGVNDKPDEINLTQVFQQIFREAEEKKQKEAEDNLENKN